MKHTYYINGMTCNGCRAHVENTLKSVDGVAKVSVNLEKAEATIDMESHIPIKKFQDALQQDGGAYSIHEHGEHHHHSENKKKEQPKGKGTGTFYCPMRRR